MRRSSCFSILIASVGLHACIDQIPTAVQPSRIDGVRPVFTTDLEPRHVVLFDAEGVPSYFVARVAALGGSVEAIHEAIGVASVSGLTAGSAQALSSEEGVRAVEPSDALTAQSEPSEAEASTEEIVTQAEPLTTAQFYSRQWNMRAVFAPEAWAAGYRGSSDVVVGILDSGIDYLNQDLAGLVDVNRSISFAPEDDAVIAARFPGRLSISDLNYHGTAVSSIVATNGKLLEGVNRHVTFIAVKIYDRSNRTTISRVIAGIMYAADQGVDVINLSGAFALNADEQPGTIAAMQRAVTYATRRGAVFVSAAGNDAVDIQHNGREIRVPCQSPQVLCVSATAPTGAGGLNGPWQDVDAIAPYTAFGRGVIAVAAPGGVGNVGAGRRVWVVCSRTTTETSSAAACIAGQPIAQPSGTSFAAPHVAGLAALIVSQIGHGKPAQVRTLIQQAADDLGDSGVDPRYGHGRINVARSLGLR